MVIEHGRKTITKNTMNSAKNASNATSVRSNARAALSILLWPLIFVSQLIIAALLSWHLLAQADFSYPWAYETMDIEEHINRFGPTNRYRPDFETTNKNDHLRLFAEIGQSIQNHGEGLAEIRYTTSANKTYTLLRKAEVIHLQDVANLVDLFYQVGGISALMLSICIAIAYKKQLALPKGKHIATGIGVLLSLIGLLLITIGPKKIFYWLHIQIFPEDHEWFFYYQDSLMTTLMKAPDLFGFIGAILGGIALLLWVVQILLVRRFFNFTKKIPVT